MSPENSSETQKEGSEEREPHPAETYEPALVLNPSGEEPGLVSRMLTSFFKAFER